MRPRESGDAAFLDDIREACALIVSRLRKKQLPDFVSDTQLQDSVVLRLIVIGEACKSLSEKTRKRYPRCRVEGPGQAPGPGRAPLLEDRRSQDLGDRPRGCALPALAPLQAVERSGRGIHASRSATPPGCFVRSPDTNFREEISDTSRALPMPPILLAVRSSIVTGTRGRRACGRGTPCFGPSRCPAESRRR
jgi:hypothetical protein